MQRIALPITLVTVVCAVAIVGLGGCGSESGGGSSEINSTPEKLDGSPSYEFEADDIERAESAPPEVQEYCEGAVSEAQEVGCLSHVEPEDVP